MKLSECLPDAEGLSIYQESIDCRTFDKKFKPMSRKEIERYCSTKNKTGISPDVLDAVQDWYFGSTEFDSKTGKSIFKKEPTHPIEMFIQGFGYCKNLQAEKNKKTLRDKLIQIFQIIIQ